MRKSVLSCIIVVMLIFSLFTSTALAATCPSCGSNHEHYAQQPPKNSSMSAAKFNASLKVNKNVRDGLDYLGYNLEINPTAADLKAKLNSFQSDSNLPASSDVKSFDTCTMDRLERRVDYVKNMKKRGSYVKLFGDDYTLMDMSVRSGDARVKVVQQWLNKYGFKVAVTGHYNGQTYEAVKAFQKKYTPTYPIDGKCGPITLSTMEAYAGTVK